MTLDEGKSFFFSMKGSIFTMAREEQVKYQLYLKLCIPKETENLWRQELLEKYYKEILLVDSDSKLCIIFNIMYDLTASIRTFNSLFIMENSLKTIKSKLSSKERIIIAETINGRGYRSVRSGLIYLSYDLNDNNKARIFADISLDLLNVITEEIDLINRITNAKILCNEIVNELGI